MIRSRVRAEQERIRGRYALPSCCIYVQNLVPTLTVCTASISTVYGGDISDGDSLYMSAKDSLTNKTAH